MSYMPIMAPEKSRERSLEMNSRYYMEGLIHYIEINHLRLEKLTKGQVPFVPILAFADSGTPPKHIFDAGLNETFVCRNAGSLFDEATLGSICSTPHRLPACSCLCTQQLLCFRCSGSCSQGS